MSKSLLNIVGTCAGRLFYDAKMVNFKLVEVLDHNLHNYASKKMDVIIDANEALAMQNPEYAAIESRRRVEGSDTVIFTSDEHNLTLEDYETQLKIRESLGKEPAIMGFYRFLYNSPVSHGFGKVRQTFQKVYRGWDETALWNLDSHLCATLGAQLQEFAKITHGWPANEKYPTFEDWQKALNENAVLLLNYSRKYDDISLEDEEKLIKDAQKALRWVATSLPSLWD